MPSSTGRQQQQWPPTSALGSLGIVITGGSKGLGFAMAREFLRAGDSVIICGRSSGRLQVALRSLAADAAAGGGVVAGVRCDVAVAQEVEALAEFAAQKLGEVHVWINNAGQVGDHSPAIRCARCYASCGALYPHSCALASPPGHSKPAAGRRGPRPDHGRCLHQRAGQSAGQSRGGAADANAGPSAWAWPHLELRLQRLGHQGKGERRGGAPHLPPAAGGISKMSAAAITADN